MIRITRGMQDSGTVGVGRKAESIHVRLCPTHTHRFTARVVASVSLTTPPAPSQPAPLPTKRRSAPIATRTRYSLAVSPMPPRTSHRESRVSDAEALRLVMTMMAIPGRSGEEAVVAEFIREQLRAVGITASQLRVDDAHRRSPIGGQIGNLVLKLPGTVRGPRR